MAGAVSFAPRPKSRVTRPGDPFTFRAQLVAAWERDPTLTILESMRETGASLRVAQKVRKDLARRGLLKSRKERIT